MTTTTKLLGGALAALALMLSLPAAAAVTGNPTRLEVGLLRTELHDGTGWVTVFDAASPTTVDLVSNPGAAFGQGAIDPGTYGKIRITLRNTAAYATSAFGGCTASTGTFPISSNGSTVALTFATAAQGGGTGWYANGSDAAPLLMSAAIDVQQGQTTQVSLQFETQGTAVCVGSGAPVTFPNAPALTVRSRVVPPVSAFAGGEYWLSHYNAARFAFDQDGLPLDPFTASSAVRAQIRAAAGYYVGFDGKIAMGAPDADGLGSIAVVRAMKENRRQLEEAGCTDCGIVDAQMPLALAYAMGTDRSFTIALPGAGLLRGAFNQDYTVFVGVGIEGTTGGQDLIVGVKAGGPQTVGGAYALAMLGAELDYPASAPTQADRLSASEFLGWLDFDAAAGTTSFSAYVSSTGLGRPYATPGTGPSDFAWSYGTKNATSASDVRSALTLDPDGAGTFVLGATQWVAFGPGGQVAIAAGDRTPTDRKPDPALIQYAQGQTLLLKQAPAGTHTVGGLAGTWTLAARWEESKVLGAVLPDLVFIKGATFGKLAWDLSGTATMEFTNNNDRGVVESVAGAGTLAMLPGGACLYGPDEGSEASRTPWAAALCPGRKIDVGVLRDGKGKDVAWLVFSADGRTGALVSPDGFTGTDPGSFRMLGYLVRTN